MVIDVAMVDRFLLSGFLVSIRTLDAATNIRSLYTYMIDISRPISGYVVVL